MSLFLFSKNNKIKCHVNDIDHELINFFNTLKTHTNKVINDFNNLLSFKNEKEYYKIIDLYKSKKGNKIERAVLFLFNNKVRGVREGLFPIGKKQNKIKMEDHKIFFEWIQKTTFTNYDYEIILRKYKNNKNVFMFLDPPYFSSFNSYYIGFNVKTTTKDNTIIDNTKMLIDIYDYMETSKSYNMLIINKNAITSHIYKKFIVDEYDKIYQMSKKKTIHLIVCNY